MTVQAGLCWSWSEIQIRRLSKRTSDGGNGSYNASDFEKNKFWSNAFVFVYMFASSPKFMILDRGFCFKRCNALFFG